MTKINCIPKGSMFVLSHGCYSDYSMMGLYIAKEDIWPQAIYEEYKKTEPVYCKADYDKRYGDTTVDKDKFLKYSNWKYDWDKWFLSTYADVMEKIPYYELHLGDYGFEEPIIYDNTQFIGGNGGIHT